MSTSDLYWLNAKSTTWVAEFRNGWGSGPAVWDYLGLKYIEELPAYSMADSHLKKVWALATDPRLEPCERLALYMSFDKAFVPVASLLKAGELAIEFWDLSLNGSQVNHWRAIGEALLELTKQPIDRRRRGVVLNCTSVADLWGQPSKAYLAEAWPIFDAAGAFSE